MNNKMVKLGIDVTAEFKGKVDSRCRILNISRKEYLTTLIENDIKSGKEPALSDEKMKMMINRHYCNLGYAYNNLVSGNYESASKQLGEVRSELWNRFLK